MTEKHVIFTYLAIWAASQVAAVLVSWKLGYISTVLIIVAPILVAASLGNIITRRHSD
ncbi:MAG: hypothetical protein OEZ10_09020 [Gammaproteobacteria bacterium]|nr:hypothetical protein [Gammaproteobacteria bacterium]